MTRQPNARLAFALGLSLMSMSLSDPARARSATASGGDSKPASPPSAGDNKSSDRIEAKPGDKKPQVRTYTSVTVVSDPTQIPRLPLPNRPPPEGRENVRALRQEIQEMRRSLRQDRPGATDARVGPAAPPADATRHPPAAGATPADGKKGPGDRFDGDPSRRAGGPGIRQPTDGHPLPSGRPELERRDPDTNRPRAIPRDPPER